MTIEKIEKFQSEEIIKQRMNEPINPIIAIKFVF